MSGVAKDIPTHKIHKSIPQKRFLHVQKLNLFLGQLFCTCRHPIFISGGIPARADILYFPRIAFLHAQTSYIYLGKHSCTCRHPIFTSGGIPARAGMEAEGKLDLSLNRKQLLISDIVFCLKMYSSLYVICSEVYIFDC